MEDDKDDDRKQPPSKSKFARGKSKKAPPLGRVYKGKSHRKKDAPAAKTRTPTPRATTAGLAVVTESKPRTSPARKAAMKSMKSPAMKSPAPIDSPIKPSLEPIAQELDALIKEGRTQEEMNSLIAKLFNMNESGVKATTAKEVSNPSKSNTRQAANDSSLQDQTNELQCHGRSLENLTPADRESNKRKRTAAAITPYTPNKLAFRTPTNTDRSAMRTANRRMPPVDECIKDIGDEDQQVLVLLKALTQDSMKPMALKLGTCLYKEYKINDSVLHPLEVCEAILKQVHEMVAKARDDYRSTDSKTFINTIMHAFAPDVDEDGKPVDGSVCIKDMALALGVDTGWLDRVFKRGLADRKAVLDGHRPLVFRMANKRRKVFDTALTIALHTWVLDQPFVHTSPRINDTVFVVNLATGVKEKLQKVYRGVPVREIFNAACKPEGEGGLACMLDEQGRILIQENTFRDLLPKQLKKMTQSNKQLCGCMCCITTKLHHTALKSYRCRQLKSMKSRHFLMTRGREKLRLKERIVKYESEVLMPDSEVYKYQHPRDEIFCLMCDEQPEFPGQRKLKCAFRRCGRCPKPVTPDEELGERELLDPMINFSTYMSWSECRIHGVISPSEDTRCKKCDEKLANWDLDQTVPKPEEPNVDKKPKRYKKLTSSRLPIGVFMKEFYWPQLKEYSRHWAQIVFLGRDHAGKTRQNSFLQNLHDIKTGGDYADKFEAKSCNNEAQSDGFGLQRSLGMEGVSVQFLQRNNDGSIKFDDDGNPIEELHFHSYLSEIARQDCRTTHMNMEDLLKSLTENGTLKKIEDADLAQKYGDKRQTVWNMVDGCAKQYRSFTAMALLSILACKYNINIDRIVGTAGHGKSWIDAFNGVDKTYLKWKMMMTFVHGSDKDGMDVAWYQNNHGIAMRKSLRMICRDLLADPKRESGVKGGSKYAKREAESKVVKRHYHAIEYEEIVLEHADYVLDKKPSSLGAANKNGIQSMHSFRADPDLGVLRMACRPIACACPSCNRKLRQAWLPGRAFKYQPRYKRNEACSLAEMFGDQNDWRLMVLKKKTAGCAVEEGDEEIEALFKDVREAMKCLAIQDIEVGGYGAVQCPGSWSLCRWKSIPFALEEDTDLDGDGDIAVKGTLVVRGLHYYELRSAPKWYEPEGNGIYDEGQPTLIRCSKVIDGKLQMGRSLRELKPPNLANAEGLGYIGVTDRGLDVLEEKRDHRDRLYDEEIL